MAADKRISEKEFGINLNLDDSDKILSFGDSRFVLNFNSGISKEGSIGAVENEKGNQLVQVILPSGNNTCIGSARDEQSNAIIYFVHNDQDNHSILRYNIDGHNIDKVLFSEPILNFQKSGRDGYITHANVVDGLLYWVDGVQEARKINIQLAIDFTRGSGGYQFLDEITITAIKPPPNGVAILRFKTDPTRTTNFLAQKGFQFAYRYVYNDFEKSVFSIWSRNIYSPWDPYLADDIHEQSRIFTYDEQENDNEFPFSAQIAYNVIDVGVQIGHQTVDFIEVVVRESEVDVWNIIRTLDNQELLLTGNTGDIVSFDFFNDSVGVAISDEDVIKSQDFFPINPKAQEFTHLNLLTYANYLDGFDLEPIDLTAAITSTPFVQFPWNFDNTQTPGDSDNLKYITNLPSPVIFSDISFVIPSVNNLLEGQLIGFMNSFIVATTFSPVGWYRITDADIQSQSVFQDSLLKTLIAQFFDVAIMTSLGVDYLVFKNNSRTPNVDAAQIFLESDWNKPTFKAGALHQFGIVYYDFWGRHGSAQSNDEAKIYVQHWGEVSPPQLDVVGYINTIELSINHIPPPWAHYYQIVYSGALNIENFVQFHYRAALDDNSDRVPGKIDIQNWTNFKNQYVRVSRNFSFEAGDFVREIKVGELLGFGAIKIALLSDKNKSEQVTGFDVNRLEEVVTSTGIFDDHNGVNNSKPPGTTPVSLIEQYKSSSESSEELIFNGIGVVFPILNPRTSSRLHGGSISQTNTTPAVIELDRGDVWTRMRPYRAFFEKFESFNALDDYINTHVIEDPAHSDYYSSLSRGYGRPFGENVDFRRTNEINAIRHTGTYIEGTKTNNLNSIDVDFRTYVNIRFGQITALREVGYTLKVLQEKKISSIYLGRKTTTSPQGTQDLILSDQVFSSINPSELDYGCFHAESVTKRDRHLYFFDVNYGKIIRDAANGMEPVSDYKAATLFKDLSDFILEETDDIVFCRGSWNDEINSYVFSFMDLPGPTPALANEISPLPLQEFTISFQEITNRWKTFHSYIPEHMEYLGKEFVTFSDGQLWRHNVSEVRGNFYGVQNEAVLTPISNIEPDAVKIFEAISLHANKKPKLIEQIIPPNDLHPLGMFSRLQGENLRWIEGNLYSALKRDLNTPNMNGASDIKKLNNGRKMRGNVCEFRIVYDTTDKVVVTRLIVEVGHSFMSG